MADRDSDTALRDEIRLIEEELAGLRESVTELRRRLGERADFPTDEAERATLITTAEEQESLIARLEARREELRQRLGE